MNYEYSTDWSEQYRQTWKDYLSIYCADATSYLEIGVWEGRSLVHTMEQCVDLDKVLCVDVPHLLPDDVLGRQHRNLRRLVKKYKIELLCTPGPLKHRDYGLFDLCYIDGSKEYGPRFNDVLFALQYCQTIVVDDCWWDQEKKCAVDYLVPAGLATKDALAYAGFDFEKPSWRSEYQIVFRTEDLKPLQF